MADNYETLLRNKLQIKQIEENKWLLNKNMSYELPFNDATTDFVSRGYAEKFAEQWKKYGNFVTKLSRKFSSIDDFCGSISNDGLRELLHYN